MQSLILPMIVAFVLPGLVAWLLGRRYGLGVVWAALIAGAVVGIYGWINTRTPLPQDAAREQAVLIFFMLLPGFVSLVLGGLIGAWQHLVRDKG
ncbi:MAG: hypothetical protein ACK5II_09460 [Paracoccus sp. (in: a-proteobacteria)]